jgi:hypothetical protein
MLINRVDELWHNHTIDCCTSDEYKWTSDKQVLGMVLNEVAIPKTSFNTFINTKGLKLSNRG